MKLTVFTQNACRYCGEAKNFLDARDVSYETINVSDNPEYVDGLGLMGAPTIILYDEDNDEVARTTGFKPEELEAIIENLE